MTDRALIAVLLPEVLDANGDAANGRVLARRALWSGIEVDLVTVPIGGWDVLARRPDIVVAGAGVENDLARASAELVAHADELRAWRDAGTEFVAVGSGWELLSEGITDETGVLRIVGAGVFPGRAVPTASRTTDDIVVDASGTRLVGFENHTRAFAGLSAEDALGTVVHGTGNGGGAEGYRVGGLLGTHLHGPVLAKNPVVADEILVRVLAARGGRYERSSDETVRADETARVARDRITGRLRL